ncbi:VOC family protein [Chryseobacterium chendengshani]|uniref:VOC family protein n=1 Tax=Chryseobacterium sp. LJ756 TaxID=2864113 RepID=UPI001C640622|nr:VOC family protein [Chryseobacterium sp. LJ756]MBW7676685.1 VOC family protein [Chryseobacterium sp. LJ756]
MVNTLNWFEIPATDFTRAKAFYTTVLGVQIHEDPNPDMQYAYLPSDPQKGGFGGAIASGENFVPAMSGTTVYLDGGHDLSVPLGRVESAGGTVILPKTAIGENRGFIALFIDTEGNRVGFHSIG